MSLLLGLDDVDLAVELGPALVNFLGRLLVEVDQGSVVGRHPLLRDAEHRPEHADL